MIGQWKVWIEKRGEELLDTPNLDIFHEDIALSPDTVAEEVVKIWIYDGDLDRDDLAFGEIDVYLISPEGKKYVVTCDVGWEPSVAAGAAREIPASPALARP